METKRGRVIAHWAGVLLVAASYGLAPIAGALGATVEDLYTVALEPDPEAANPRQNAITRAMEQVLVRVTGSRGAPRAPELQPLIQNAARSYLNSYAFLETGEVEVGFISRAVEQALQQRNWPVWGPERPSTMLWVAVESELGERAIVSSGELDTGYEHSEQMQALLLAIREELSEAAYGRAIPFTLPVFDLEDMIAVDFADIWTHDYDVLVEAAARYEADAIIVGRLRDGLLGLDSEWTLLVGGEQRLLLGTGVTETIDWLADQFATQFGVVGGVRPLQIRISGVQGLEHYGRVMSYLDSVSLLERVDVNSFEDGVLSLDVQSRGSADVLSRVLGLNAFLVLSPEPIGSEFFGERLNFEIAMSPVPQ